MGRTTRTRTTTPPPQFTEMTHGTETLRPLPDWPGYYASDSGHIYSTAKGLRKLKLIMNKRLKVWVVNLYHPDRRYLRTLKSGRVVSCVKPAPRAVHGLVASVWLPPRPSPLHEVHHVDEDRRNNTPGNLAWATKQENIAFFHANHPEHGKGTRNAQAKLTETDIPAIRVLRGLLSPERVAGMFGVHNKTIWSVWAGRSWRHVA